MQGHRTLGLIFAVAVLAGCHTTTSRPEGPGPAAANNEPTTDGIVVGDEKTSIEAAVEANASSRTETTEVPSKGIPLAENAPDSYVVKRGDTLWGIAKVFLRDPWYWPEIWQVNPQVHNPHLIYPGDTLRLVYINGQPQIVLQRGDGVRVEPRVRSEPIDSAITTIPYATVAAFMSKPSVLDRDQIKVAPYVLATRDLHVVMSEGDTLYARGFTTPAELGSHYNVVRVGDPLIDPDDKRLLGYDGIYTGSGHVTRQGDPTTLIMTESARESRAGDKLIPGGVDVPLDFIPSAPRVKTEGRIISVSNGVTVIGQYEVVVVNRGARDGLAPGNVLGVFDTGPLVADTDKKGFFSVDRFGTKRVQLPSERTGTFMVFKTFDNISYGLIMEATNLIRVGDKIENP
ncbi:MAG TPA: LysM peptidoglycan-binding domain-containing protein [Steroidobacteraceae bacterium]|jgi:LysM repeat protein|nr:LysM peptidoglycan-binding domain-containing protein [Steroidobacteraceae bacterium]